MLTQRASYTDCSEMKETYITHSPEETEALGASVASGHDCTFTALYGDLGAGKTVFVRGMVSVLSPDAKNLVHSPTYAIVNEYGDAGQRVYHFDMYRIRSEEDLYACSFYDYLDAGAAVARTVAMELAQGEYMAFLDSDDLWMPEKLARQLQFMQQNKYHFTCTAYEQMDQQGHSTGKVIRTKPKTDYNGVLLTCPVGNSTVMYNVGAMGKFKVPNIRKRNDDALWLQMLKKERYIYGMPDVLMRYRIREGSISVKKTALIKYHWKLYREIEHLSVFRSVFHIGCWVLIKVFHIK